MADTRNIVIELKLQDSNGGNSLSNKNVKDETGSESNLSVLLHPIKASEKAVLGKNIIVYQAYQQTKSMIKQSAMYEINKYFSLTENYKTQQDMNNALTSISKVTNFGTSIISGAVMGSSAGPIGAVAGAAIAATGYIVNEGIQTFQRFQQQTRNLATMNVESSFQLTRMGLIDGGRGSYN